MPVLGAIERSEFTLSLSFDLRLLDASGRPVWARTYADHAGLLVWTSPRIGEEPLQVGLVRLANEAAWRLAQRAALDLRQWLADERYRARAL
jgi:hypothetical protein